MIFRVSDQGVAAHVLTLGSLMPVMRSSGRSSTRKAARLAVYDATMIIANPAHTIPRILAEKLLGAPTEEQTQKKCQWEAEYMVPLAA